MSQPDRAIVQAFTRGTHLLRSGLCEEALRAFRTIYAKAEAADDGLQMAACLCEIAWCYYRLGNAEAGLQSAIRAREIWQGLGNRLEVSRAMAIEAILLLDIGCSQEAYDLSTEALDIAESGGEPAMLAFALNATGLALTACGKAELGAGVLDRAVAIADQMDNDAAAAYYLLNLGLCHARLAEEAGILHGAERAEAGRQVAIAFGDVAIARAESSGDAWTRRSALRNGAELLARDGGYDRALDYLDQAVSLPGDPGIGLRFRLLQTTGEVLLRSGSLDDARITLEQALALADSAGDVNFQVSASGTLAEILEALGEHTAALAAHKRFHALYVRQSAVRADTHIRVAAIRAGHQSGPDGRPMAEARATAQDRWSA